MVMACGRAVVKDVRDSDGPATTTTVATVAGDLRGRAAAGEQRDRAFAHAARSDRGAVGQQASEQSPEPQIQAR